MISMGTYKTFSKIYINGKMYAYFDLNKLANYFGFNLTALPVSIKILLENTVVNILPDHLFMGNPTFITENGNRELFFITNSKLSEKFINQNSPFYQVDIPGIILDASNISHNAKFFSNYYDCNIDSLIKIKHNDIKSLNISGFTRIIDQNSEKMKIDIKQSFQKNKSKFIAHGGGEINGDIYTNSLESLNQDSRRHH